LTSIRRPQPVELRLVVVLPDGRTRDVAVEAAPTLTTRDLLEAIGRELGADAGSATLHGEPLRADVPVSELALRWGDELNLAGANGAAAAPLATLVVTGGPDAGRRIPLPAGTHTVGREAGISIDDPSLSGHHVVVTVAPDGAVAVADAGSRNGSLLDGTQLEPGQPHPLEPGTFVRAGRSLLGVDAPERPAHPQGGSAGLVQVNRPPRVRRVPQARLRPFPAPTADPQRARLPLGAALIPLALGVGLFLVTHLPTMLFFSLMSPVMAATTYVEDRRSGRKGFKTHSREYRLSLADLREELETERTSELAARRAVSPAAPELIARARRHDPALWERRPGDDDFLELGLGTADLPSLLTLQIDAGGSAELRREAESLVDWYSTAPAVPVTIRAADAGTVGISGPRERVDSLARWLVAQAAALHSPAELVIAAALGPGAEDGWDWLKWLPHSDDANGQPAPRIGIGPVAARGVVEEVGRLVAARRGEDATGLGGAQRRLPHVLLVVDETVAPERSLATQVLAAAEVGVSVVWLARQRRDLPGESTIVVQLEEGSARLAVTNARDGSEHTDVSADGLGVERALELALALAPTRDPGGGGTQSVPTRVSLLDLLDVEEPTAEWVADRWESADGLGAVVGATAGGTFGFDLREDGPHGLVAGMTGAGKSELLQSLLASLAISHPPSRLAFLLVDYKGGTAFKDCLRFPHTVGLVTDLNAHLTRRALASLNAELQRRERILRDADAKDLADLERRAPEQAPPSLLIVIDEFATLAKEVPDFIEGIVDVAQRGRSLGVHLLLATQRPGGTVSENIRANTNLRIALRVNESAESADVIGTADAARIQRDRPGRAFARTGHGELTELQTAYVGGTTTHATADVPVIVRPFNLDGATGTARESRGVGDSDLAQLVEAARAAAERLGLATPSSPWLEALPAELPLDVLEVRGDGPIVVGMIDEPQRQLQRPLELDLEREGSLLIYGSSGAGKTTLLRTLAAALARGASPDDLHLYGLDFATRGLAPLEHLPHVGAVIGGDDQERVERLFSLLRSVLERRKVQFAQAGVFSLSDYRARPGAEPMPRIVVLLDGYAGFASAFERVNLGEMIDALPRIVAEGRPLGVHFAITADRRGAVPNSLAGIIPTRLVLRMADEDEFASLGVEPRVVRGALLPPGRGFLPGGVEFQAAQLAGDPASFATLGDSLRERYGDGRAPAIEPLPTAVSAASLPAAGAPWQATIGIADSDLEVARIDLSVRHFLVVGPYRSGRSTALRTIVESLRASTSGLDLYLFAPRRSPLLELEGWTKVATGDGCDDAATELANTLVPDRPALVVIDDGEELAESLGAAALETLVRRGRDLPLRVLATAERQAAQRAFSGWLRELRKEEHGLLLDPDPDVDGDILGTRLPRRSNPVFPPGRGYLVERGTVELVQVASSLAT
jgi:S-DNA-T family DNA segregation ATPase FtsK/SpoIIIE